jgi:multidrug efflux pump subunit AcrA (membrane-fusion protein)
MTSSETLLDREYRRVRQLFEKGGVGSISAVEAAERALISHRERITQLENGLDALPFQKRELEVRKASARLSLSSARLDLERTEIKAAISGRIEMAAIEKGTVVSPGRELLRLVDDTVLEMAVSLDGAETARWLPFEKGDGRTWWFGVPACGPVRISWVEEPDQYTVQGRLVRIEKYDRATRTVTGVIELAPSPGAGPKLVEGMFCRADIPGKTVDGVFAVPRSSVEPDGTVYVARDDRLVRVKTLIVHSKGEYVLIRADLDDGELMILTRLLSPVEGSLLKVSLVEGGAEE